MAELEQWLTLDQVCQMMNISKHTLHRWRKAGIIKDSYPKGRPAPGFHGNITVRIAKSEVERVMASGSVVDNARAREV